MSSTTETRPASSGAPAGRPPRSGARAAALVIGGVLTFAFLGWAILALVTLTSWQTADGSRTFSAPVKRVLVHTDGGGVTLSGGTATGTTASASWHSRWYFFHPHVQAALGADGTLTVRTSCGRGKWLPISCNVGMRLKVPSNVPVDVSSSGGSVTASDLAGGMVVSSSGGGVHLDRVAGSVRVSSSGGGIHLNDVAGALTLNSSGGGISGTAVGSQLTSRTITTPNHSTTIVTAPVLTTVSASSSGGGVRLTFTTPPQSVRARSSGGGIRIALPDVAGDYRIHASSSGGGVHVDIPSNDRSSRVVDVSSSGGGVRVTRAAG